MNVLARLTNLWNKEKRVREIHIKRRAAHEECKALLETIYLSDDQKVQFRCQVALILAIRKMRDLSG